MRLLISTLLLLLLAAPATAAEGYYIGPKEGVDLRLAPRSDAKISDHLNYREEVEIIDRQRNWAKVRTTDSRGIRGWVPAGAVRKSLSSTPSKKSSSSFFSSFASIFRSSEPEQKTAVLGVRGLEGGDGNTADKKAGEKAKQAVEWMDTLNVSQREVSAFVKEGRLNP